MELVNFYSFNWFVGLLCFAITGDYINKVFLFNSAMSVEHLRLAQQRVHAGVSSFNAPMLNFLIGKILSLRWEVFSTIVFNCKVVESKIFFKSLNNLLGDIFR
jgi:hypothetical protein